MQAHHMFGPAKILLPRQGTDMEKWATLACDQFTSQPEYWQRAAAFVGDAPSCLNLILPEVYLEEPGVAGRIEKIHRSMDTALRDVLARQVNGFVFVRRTTESGVRRGLVGVVDLEQYCYDKGAQPLIRPTENTVESRIPPRLAVRRGAPLESPHILMLVDDPKDTVLGPITAAASRLPLLYDTPLMLGGGHIEGRAVEDASLIERVLHAVDAFETCTAPTGCKPLGIAVGDGNHSLATAKAWWEEIKPGLTDEEKLDHPARYCLVELENLHDDAILIEPIHRVVFGAARDEFAEEMRAFFAAQGTPLVAGKSSAQRFVLLGEGQETTFSITGSHWPLCVGGVEAFLADYLAKHPAVRVDYIHGEASVRELAQAGALGLLLPPLQKSGLLGGVRAGGVLPKKTFSMGHAEEKRYYLECRKITR